MPDLHAAHETVVRDGRRQTRRHRAIAALGAAAVVAAISTVVWVGAGGDGGDGRGAIEPPTELPAVPAPPIEGAYRSRPVSFSDMAATLRDSGLARDVPALRRLLGSLDDARLRLTMRDGESRVRVPGTGVELAQLYTLGTYEIRMVTAGTPSWRYTFRTNLTAPISEDAGHSLTLTLLDTTAGTWDGVSNEAWLVALFTTVSYQEVSD